MKFAIIFIIFSSIVFLNKSQISPVLNNHSSRPICKIINDVIRMTNDTQDVLIGNLGDQGWSQKVNDIIECIDDDKAVVVTDLKGIHQEKKLRKGSVIVLSLQHPNRDLVRQLIMTQHFSTVWHHMAKVICIVPASTSLQMRFSILQAFTNFGFFNVVTVHTNENEDIYVDVVVSISGKVKVEMNPNDSTKLFPDKLKDMTGFYYTIPIFHQPPIVHFMKTTISAPMLHFLKLVVEKQNAGLKLNVIPSARSFEKLWQTRQMHLTLNTAVSFDNPEPKLINYEKRGFCALVPIPERTLTFRLMIIMPFDYLIWVPFLVSIAGSVAVWWMYRGRGAVDSHWLLLAEIYKMFFGQGFTLSRNNHFMLLTLMQLICLLTFIISNAYESEITSCMIEPFYENRLGTVDDLIASDYKIMTDEGFAYVVKDNQQFQAIRSRMTVVNFHSSEHLEEEVGKRDYVLITMCDVTEKILKIMLVNGEASSGYYYMLPELILWDFVRLEGSYMNPFMERFQFYMDLSFQAGLPHMWKVVENMDQSRYSVPDTSDNLESLRLEDLHEVFKVLGIGLAVSVFMFLFEIFYHDCLVNIDGHAVLECLRLRAKRMCCKLRKSKPKVRRIFVQPRN